MGGGLLLVIVVAALAALAKFRQPDLPCHVRVLTPLIKCRESGATFSAHATVARRAAAQANADARAARRATDHLRIRRPGASQIAALAHPRRRGGWSHPLLEQHRERSTDQRRHPTSSRPQAPKALSTRRC